MAETTCRICDRFFGRERSAIGVCTSCGAGFCEEHGLQGASGGGLCLFCAEEFGSRFDAHTLEEEGDL